MCQLVIVEVKTREQRVIVEHLLEMWHQPLRICRIAVKTAAELIVDAAFSHFATASIDDFQRLFSACAVIDAKQEVERHRWWKFRSAAKTAIG